MEMLTSLPGRYRYANRVVMIVVTPIAMVITPTAPCRPLLAQVSQRAEAASGTAITLESDPIPTIEPIPNGATSPHPTARAEPEKRAAPEPTRGPGAVRSRQHHQRRRAGHAMHQSDQQRAPAKAMRMGVCGAAMRYGFAGMAMGVDVNRAVAVAVTVKMHALAPQPPQHMGPETDQHDADGGLQWT